jgi:probable HAF family extracellular repeat protein
MLTARFVESVQPTPGKRVEYFDEDVTGLALRVTDRGAKSWTVLHRHLGHLRRLTLGNTSVLTLAKALMLSIVLLVASTADAQPYRVLEVPAGSCATLWDLNRDLRAVGSAPGLGYFLWDIETGQATALPLTYGPLAINDNGVIVGARRLPNSPLSPLAFPTQVFASVNGATFDLPTPSVGFAEVTVRRVTNSGIVFIDARFNGRWAIYQSQLYQLPDADDINGQGIVVGRRFDSSGPVALDQTFMRWPDGREILVWQKVLPIPGDPPLIGSSGHVVQALPDCCNGGPGFIYLDANSLLTRVSTPAKVALSRPNRGGEVVGTLTPSNGPSRGFLYSDGQMIDLTNIVTLPIGPVRRAKLITDGGAIVVTGWHDVSPWCERDYVLVPAAPASPTRLRFTVTDRIVTLEWDPVAGASGYIVEAGSAPGLRDLHNAPVGSVVSSDYGRANGTLLRSSACAHRRRRR